MSIFMRRIEVAEPSNIVTLLLCTGLALCLRCYSRSSALRVPLVGYHSLTLIRQSIRPAMERYLTRTRELLSANAKGVLTVTVNHCNAVGGLEDPHPPVCSLSLFLMITRFFFT